ncbi:long-chain-fatty-acid--CoA ligase [Microbacterium betulae]|uniref:Long-chain-fatty-acid--CoA ligase n=1 Tax=Microbacterium betulae TaxID=2981139 RepID=A0AA97I6X6_9MICO|nr:long-chain-fatty-acid--CoA ligase [Microbacterium sp. AB]WOF22845.1 long-chain-fatty-acid--CoA ligase [Microbacterium sp. AB]
MSSAVHTAEVRSADADIVGRGMTMSDQLARQARVDGGRIAFVYDATRRSYREVDERVSRLANALRERGVGHGDRVVVLGFNTLEVIEAYFAVVRLGAICVPVNFRLVAHEIAYILEDSGAAAAVVQARFLDVVTEARSLAGETGSLLVFGGEPRGDAEEYEGVLAQAEPSFREHRVELAEPAFIMYTSGTTGRPKGAVLTHNHLLLHSVNTIAHSDAPMLDRVNLVAAPLFHVAAMAGLLKPLMLGGRTIVQPFGAFDPAALLDLVERERISSLFLVPTQWQAVCEVPGIERRDLSSLRRIAWGGAPATIALLELLNATFPQAPVVSVFGQTECGPITAMLQGADQVRKIGSIGLPTLNVEVRVVDDDLNDVAAGEVGEIVYRTPMVMKEYWNKPEATAEAFRGGWFHSGDLVRRDEEGYLYIVDRKKDMIISGGENIYCAEVENVLAGHPKVREVAVVGVPHEKWGETPLAVIVPQDPGEPPTTDELTGWLAPRLARYKRPHQVAIVGSLPRNSLGKVLKDRIRRDREAGRLSVQAAR